MNLVANAPLDQTALAAALDFCKEIPKLGPGQFIKTIYMHWRVSAYSGGCCDYNALISLREKENRWVGHIAADPRLNATSPPQPGYAAHTYMRNTYAFGIAVEAMAEATEHDFGPYPITLHEMETLCACVGAIAFKYGVDLSDPARCMTHGEAAILDSYFITDSPSDGITRWDLARLTPSPASLTKDECRATGKLLRARSRDYKLEFMRRK